MFCVVVFWGLPSRCFAVFWGCCWGPGRDTIPEKLKPSPNNPANLFRALQTAKILRLGPPTPQNHPNTMVLRLQRSSAGECEGELLREACVLVLVLFFGVCFLVLGGPPRCKAPGGLARPRRQVVWRCAWAPKNLVVWGRGGPKADPQITPSPKHSQTIPKQIPLTLPPQISKPSPQAISPKPSPNHPSPNPQAISSGLVLREMRLRYSIIRYLKQVFGGALQGPQGNLWGPGGPLKP